MGLSVWRLRSVLKAIEINKFSLRSEAGNKTIKECTAFVREFLPLDIIYHAGKYTIQQTLTAVRFRALLSVYIDSDEAGCKNWSHIRLLSVRQRSRPTQVRQNKRCKRGKKIETPCGANGTQRRAGTNC